MRLLATSLVLAATAFTIAALAVIPALALEETHVVEPESKIKFAKAKTMLGESLTLTGVAIREKTIFKVDVYAIGHYVEPVGARKALSKWKDKKAKELAGDDAFMAALQKDGFTRTIVLELARDVDAEDFNDAFEDALLPRVKKLVKSGVVGSAKDVATLKGYFTIEELAEGTVLDFTWQKGGKLTSAMGGTHLGEMTSPALCKALWDVYLGDDAIQSEFPRKLTSLFPAILKDPKKTQPKSE